MIKISHLLRQCCCYQSIHCFALSYSILLCQKVYRSSLAYLRYFLLNLALTLVVIWTSITHLLHWRHQHVKFVPHRAEIRHQAEFQRTIFAWLFLAWQCNRMPPYCQESTSELHSEKAWLSEILRFEQIASWWGIKFNQPIQNDFNIRWFVRVLVEEVLSQLRCPFRIRLLFWAS